MLFKRYVQNPEFVIKPKFMSEKSLSEMYSARPVVCTDIILFQSNSKSVYLPYRKITPGEGLWVIGGARWAGESAEQTAVRRLKNEVCLEISPSRLTPIGVIEYIWPYRREEPKDEGRHDINYIFGLEVSNEELDDIRRNLDKVEYDVNLGLRQFKSVDELRAADVKENIIDYYKELFGA